MEKIIYISNKIGMNDLNDKIASDGWEIKMIVPESVSTGSTFCKAGGHM
jgi:hypothetical protein